MRDRSLGPVILVGAVPAEGPQTLYDLGIPFHLVLDPEDTAPGRIPGVADVMTLPYKRDPLSVLDAAALAPVSGVLSFTEYGLFPAAILAESLGLPTVPAATVARTRNKLLMRQALHGVLDQPAFGVVGRTTPAPEQLPIIVKPADGSGSRGVEYIEDLGTYLRREPDLQGFLWEQYLTGTEFSVETVSFEGEHHIVGITEKFTVGERSFVELGHLVPAQLPPDQEAEVRRTVPKVLDGLGIDRGGAHTEVMVTGSHVFLIETHTRPGGDRIPLLHRLVSGQDQYRLAVQSLLGLPSRIATERQQPRFAFAGVRYFRWADGRVRRIDGVDVAAELPGVVELEIRVGPGDTLSDWRLSRDRPGHCVIGGHCADEVHAGLSGVEAKLSVVYEQD
ncbi:MAG TPA: ATP-grasp domain-containing protein [Streptosporangiaceae bacterium]|nr:ATP-grasp domain-containing protein [Streptosporangiaceae bacterium]